MPVAIPVAIAAAGAIAGGIGQSMAAGSAASAQEGATSSALAALQGNYSRTQSNLLPYMQLGALGSQGLQNTWQNLIAPFNPTMQQLAATPGYQFTLQQGLQGVQNSSAAQGLGTSGQALAGAANYASGLASTTYQQQFQNYLAQNSQIYNMLSGLTNTGLNANQTLANVGANQATNTANLTAQLGTAQAAAAQQGITSLAGIPGALGNNAMQAYLLSNSPLFGGGGGSTGSLGGEGGSFDV